MQTQIDEKSLKNLESTINTIKNEKLIISKPYIILKRFLDIVLGIVGLVGMIPVTICVVIGKIITKDNGPIFYKHNRIGKNGQNFKLYKYRTMVVDADKILDKYLEENPEAKKEFQANFKLSNDPRITKFGRFLRKTSIDEIPQFINVIKGDMSIIGPRPIVEKEIGYFGDSMKIVHNVKPGITGYWAANGRSNTTYEERVEMETYYAQNYSLWLDVKIFFATIIKVIKKEGAK